jgi:hypothetical protein
MLDYGHRPPDPHDPAERCWVDATVGWHVLRHAANDPRTPELAASGRLHLQLWHPSRRVSVLTASGATQGLHELWAGGHRERFACWGCLGKAARTRSGVVVPAWPIVAELERWLVHLSSVGCVPHSTGHIEE